MTGANLNLWDNSSDPLLTESFFGVEGSEISQDVEIKEVKDSTDKNTEKLELEKDNFGDAANEFTPESFGANEDIVPEKKAEAAKEEKPKKENKVIPDETTVDLTEDEQFLQFKS